MPDSRDAKDLTARSSRRERIVTTLTSGAIHTKFTAQVAALRDDIQFFQLDQLVELGALFFAL
jgi:hypothetical protein